jgi:hypothetical protein
MIRNGLTFLITLLLAASSVCGQSFDYRVQTPSSEKGYVGKIGKLRLYYEVWEQSGAAGTSTHSLILRTNIDDMTDSVDFYWPDYIPEDSAFRINVTIGREDTTLHFTTTRAKDIPGVFQVLIPFQYGYQFFHNFNKPGSPQRIYIKGNELHLIYLDQSDRFTDPGKIHLVYRFSKGEFKLVR